MTSISRRKLFKQAGATIGATALGIPLFAGNQPEKKLKIVVAGAHPDDPETGCGGLVALLTQAGHQVTLAYLTRGEAGIEGVSHEEAATIRTQEAQEACKILGAQPHFLGQIDGSTVVNREEYEKTFAFLQSAKADLLLAHWPVDTHRDHRICSMLFYDAWLRLEERPELFYFEVMSGVQSQNFAPTDFVDISSVAELKHKACFIHKSQKIEDSYPDDHGKMEVFRGMESGCRFAEGYIRHTHNRQKFF